VIGVVEIEVEVVEVELAEAVCESSRQADDEEMKWLRCELWPKKKRRRRRRRRGERIRRGVLYSQGSGTDETSSKREV